MKYLLLFKADKIAFEKGYKNYKKGYFHQDHNEVNNKLAVPVYTIPVVFHVMHQNGSEKISPTQINDAIRILNIDFNKKNTDTNLVIPDFKNHIGDVQFNFVLASKDPDGNCTNGIVYHNSELTNWTSGSNAPFTGKEPGMWNPTKYLNIYSVKSISSGAAGYTYYPGSWGTGDGHDCIVILYDYVGAIGTGQISTSRALTHEVGHWFNLPHVWGNNNSVGVVCGDEGVSDTPETKGYKNCPSSAIASQICNSGISENYQNYMDYSYCSHMFTEGQVVRMHTAINENISGRDNLSSDLNLIETGVKNQELCFPKAFFTTVGNKRKICTGGQITFLDSTWNTKVTSWQWSFPGGEPSTSSDSMPTVKYNSPGLYPVIYTASNNTGINSKTVTNFITVTPEEAKINESFTESFETISLPNEDWQVETGSDGITWEENSATSFLGNKCLFINNFQNTPGDIETFYTPTINFNAIKTKNPGLTFTFKLAYKRKSAFSSEKLEVYSSSNCGQTWSKRYTKSGSALATVTETSETNFVPAPSQWRTESVSINPLTSYSNVQFKFIFSSDPNGDCNSIYIDDLTISNSPIGLNEDQNTVVNSIIYPNPTHRSAHLSMNIINYNSNLKIDLIDMLGKVYQKMEFKDLAPGKYEFDLGKDVNLTPGIYFVMINYSNQPNETLKLIIEN